MIMLVLILLPLAAGLLCFLITADTVRRLCWLITALVHLGFTLFLLFNPGTTLPGGWLACDSLSVLFIFITSVLFAASTLYGMHYMRTEAEQRNPDNRQFIIFRITREAAFTGFLLIFLATMSLVTFARHMGLLWIAVEATTLASAPLIYFHRNHKSLEATWKYLIVCSVGIALALLGIYFLAAASLKNGIQVHLTLDELLRQAASCNPTWLKAAFLLILVGFGTKMGLVPMHTWLPGAHSEAPALVSALLSGTLLNCSFLAILRLYQLMTAAGLGAFARELLLIFGLLSMTAAAFLLISKRDYKRMLAYSSIENMGILAAGIGLAATSTYGSLLHTLNHSLVKAALFLAAGNILLCYKSKKINAVQGIFKKLPYSGVIWFAGFLAITGTPPFGIFTSKWIILRGTVLSGNIPVIVIFLGALVLSFIALARIVFRMAFNNARPLPADSPAKAKEPFLSVAPSFLLLAAVLCTGLWIPGILDNLIRQAAAVLGGF